MELKVLGCYGSESEGMHSAGFLLNGHILLEAGAVTTPLTAAEQLEITHILISHAHLDHTKELIFLVDGFFLQGRGRIVVMGIRDVLEQLRTHLLNDQLWPDFTRIPRGADGPTLELVELAEGRESRVEELSVVPVRVDHAVPASGFILTSGGSALAYSGDTGPTEELWRRAGAMPELGAVIVETSFPDELEDLAVESGHLTPRLLGAELAKLGRPEVPVYISHMKPAFAERIKRQLGALRDYDVRFLEQGARYEF